MKKNLLKEELDSIRKDQDLLNKRILNLEKKISPQETATNETRSLYEEEAPVEKQQSTKAPGIIFLILGFLIFVSSHAFLTKLIGAGLFVGGIILLSRGGKTTIKSQESLREETENKTLDIKKEKTEDKTQKTTQETKEKKSLEEAVGIKWFSIVGILALVMGVGFFVKYAIDMNWINHLTRIILGVVLGIGLVTFGDIISKKEKYAAWGKTLVGGGFAITYFVIYAAYHFQEYRFALGISQPLTIFLLTTIVFFAILFSLKDNSQIIAAGAFLLGYITSLLSTNLELLSIIYTLMLTAGLVIVVSYKKWQTLGLGGVIASYLLYGLWSAENIMFEYVSLILIFFFLAFTIQSFLLIRKEKALEENIVTILLNSALFFILYFLQTDKIYPDYTGIIALSLTLSNFLLYHTVQNKEETNKEKYKMTYFYLGLLFFTISIPLIFNGVWITIIWALKALLISFLYTKLKIKILKISAYALGIITATKTLIYDMFLTDSLNITTVINSTRLFSFLVTIVCFFLIYKIFKENKELFTKDEQVVILFYSWLATGLFALIMIIELILDYSIFLSCALGILAIVLMTLSRKGSRELYYQGVFLMGVMVLKNIFYDLFFLDAIDTSNIMMSTRAISVLTTIAILYFLANLTSKKESEEKQLQTEEKSLQSPRIFSQIYSYAASILATILILVELTGFWISVGWSMLALIIIISGFYKRKSHLRIQGIIIFGITIFKVFIIDTSHLDTIYRTSSYMGLGIILLLVSFIYAKYRENIKEKIL